MCLCSAVALCSVRRVARVFVSSHGALQERARCSDRQERRESVCVRERFVCRVCVSVLKVCKHYQGFVSVVSVCRCPLSCLFFSLLFPSVYAKNGLF